MINTILFDLDDTLYNERDFVLGGFREVCSYLSYKYHLSSEELCNETISILKQYGRGHIFNLLCDRYNICEDIADLVELYRNAKPRIELYSDGIQVLKLLKGKYNTGIITDGKASVQWNKIKLLGLEKLVDKIIVTDDYGRDYWKPHEFGYKQMLKDFKVMPSQCIYIGDNPNKDFVGARKLGVNTVRVLREFGDHMNTFLDQEYEADYKIKSLLELKGIIKIIDES